jgi:hypothetical protein
MFDLKINKGSLFEKLKSKSKERYEFYKAKKENLNELRNYANKMNKVRWSSKDFNDRLYNEQNDE